VQVIKKYFNGKEKHQFIDKTKITAIIINEGIKSYDVLFYMAIIMEGHNKMVLALMTQYPKYAYYYKFIVVLEA